MADRAAPASEGTTVQLMAVRGIGEVGQGDDVAALIRAALAAQGLVLHDGDVLVVASKILAKAQGRWLEVDPGESMDEARRRHARTHEVLVDTPFVTVVRTDHGFVCANAGIDASNAGGRLLDLPEDPDADAAWLRGAMADLADVGVVVSDTFGRAWREGQTDIALGVAGIPAVRDERGRVDRDGQVLNVTLIAVADQIAGAADLVRDKAAGVPVVVVRGLDRAPGVAAGTAAELVRSPAADLFPHGRGWLARRLATGEGAPVRSGPPTSSEWTQVLAAARLLEAGESGEVGGRTAHDQATGTLSTGDGLAAGRAEACLLDLGYAVTLRTDDDGVHHVQVG